VKPKQFFAAVVHLGTTRTECEGGGREALPQTIYYRDGCTGPDIETQDKAKNIKGTLTGNSHSLRFQNFCPKSLSFVQKMIFGPNIYAFYFLQVVSIIPRIPYLVCAE